MADLTDEECAVCGQPLSHEHSEKPWRINVSLEALSAGANESDLPIPRGGLFCSEACLKMWAHNGFQRPSYILARKR